MNATHTALRNADEAATLRYVPGGIASTRNLALVPAAVRDVQETATISMYLQGADAPQIPNAAWIDLGHAVNVLYAQGQIVRDRKRFYEWLEWSKSVFRSTIEGNLVEVKRLGSLLSEVGWREAAIVAFRMGRRVLRDAQPPKAEPVVETPKEEEPAMQPQQIETPEFPKFSGGESVRLGKRVGRVVWQCPTYGQVQVEWPAESRFEKPKRSMHKASTLKRVEQAEGVEV